MAASAALTGLFGLVLYCIFNPRQLRAPSSLTACCTHAGLLLMVLGVAFSGPYQSEGSLVMKIGDTDRIGAYSVTLEDIYKGEGAGYSFYEARLRLEKDGRESGILAPERRTYFKQSMPFAEATTIFSLGDEPYASLLAVDEARGLAQVHLTVNPLINWILIGGIILCLFPLFSLFSLFRKPRKPPPN